MTEATLKTLRNQLSSPELLLLEQTDLDNYSHDESTLTGEPAAVVMAANDADVLATVNFCLTHNLQLIPRGAGTGLSGGCVPSTGAIVLSTENLDELQILPQDKVAICGPGVITKDLRDQAELLGLTYPPDPASYKESTLGGNVAENAGGLRCKRFGVTKDYVVGLEAVTGEGLLLKTGVFSESNCFAIEELLIGSEGTLAVITKIALRLIDLPLKGETILVAFSQPEDAAQAVAAITTSGIIPTVLEYLDGDTVALSNDYEKAEGIDQAEGVLLIETSDGNARTQAKAIEAICRKHNCSYFSKATDPAQVELMWNVRRNIAHAAKAAAKTKLSEDIAVPNSRFPDMVAFVAELNRTSSVRINSFGHAGDGNLHANLLGQIGDPQEQQVIDEAVDQILKKALDLRGTLSGEHGIGLTKREYLPLEFDPPTLELMRSIKELFDPKSILNQDKLFPPKS